MVRLETRNISRYSVNVLLEKTCGKKYDANADSSRVTRAALAAVKFMLADGESSR
jgi:hypothetical protein